MTSEVLLMNLEAVALGADSAVTLSGGDRGRVSQPGIDKLFLINDAGPVATMFYANAEYAGLPWRTIMGEFRHACGPQPLPFPDYGQRLTTFLGDLSAHPALPADPNAEMRAFSAYVRGFIRDYLDYLIYAGWTRGEPVNARTASKALEIYADAILIASHAHDDDKGKMVEAELRPRTGQGSERLDAFLKTHLGPAFEQIAGKWLKDSQLPPEALSALMDLCAQSVLIEWLPKAAKRGTTGLVITGFGAGAAVPAYLSLRILGAFGGVLQYSVLGEDAPTSENPVIIEPFAQADMTKAFLNGAMPGFTEDAAEATFAVLDSVFSQTLYRVAHDNPKLGRELSDVLLPLRQFIPDLALKVAAMSHRDYVDSQLQPLLDAANAKVLGEFAHKLMTLPVTESELLRNDTVARPVYVLTLSRGQHSLMIDGVKQ